MNIWDHQTKKIYFPRKACLLLKKKNRWGRKLNQLRIKLTLRKTGQNKGSSKVVFFKVNWWRWGKTKNWRD